MAKNLGGLIHNFIITQTHKTKICTIYKITSIVSFSQIAPSFIDFLMILSFYFKIFPPSIPEALTKISVWKRFKEIKHLYQEIKKKHKENHLKGQVPDFPDSSYFKRFDPEVIQNRKQWILEFLYFIADHPTLYMSQSFIHFFERGQESPTHSPEHKVNSISVEEDEMSKPMSPEVMHTSASGENLLDDSGSVKSDEIDAPLPVLKVDTEDYLFAAAIEFSHAVSDEVYQRYEVAFERYKKGIDLLLSGAKSNSFKI